MKVRRMMSPKHPGEFPLWRVTAAFSTALVAVWVAVFGNPWRRRPPTTATDERPPP